MSRDFLAKNYSKEQIYVLEIDVPRCIHVHGSSPCTATQTGNAKCYNTRTTCNDLANYNEDIEADGDISADASAGTFTKSAGTSFITEGFKPGDIITVSGFTNDGNNRQFKLKEVTATVLTVVSNYKMVTESAGTSSVTRKNIFTYQSCSPRSPHPQNMNNIVPCLDSVSISPARVDPKGGIGARASVSISMSDLPGSDRNGIDPYLDDRTYDPFEVGLYWLKWRARNANYENLNARVLSGYITNNKFQRRNFEERCFVLSSMTASQGKASIGLKDPLQLISNKTALAPRPSTGTLSSAITESTTSVTLQPAGVGDSEYPASGEIKVRDEVMTYTRSGDTFTITRGQFNTVADSHDLGDTAQLCLNYDGSQTGAEVQYDLIVNYGNVPAYYVPGNQWQTETDDFLPSNPNRLITDPTKVDTLIGQLSQQWPHKLFWNDRRCVIDMVALKAPPSGLINTLDSDSNIMELSVQDKPDMQVSTVLVFYGQFDPTKKVDEKDNYQITYSRVNTDAIARYDSNNTKTIYAPFIVAGNGAAARRLAQLEGRRFGITPREVNFTLEDKDSQTWIGDIIGLRHFDICSPNGFLETTTFEVTSASEGADYRYRALEYNFDEELAADELLTGEIVDLPLSETNINLRTKYEEQFGTPDSDTDVKFIVFGGVVIGSTSNAVSSIETGSWPAGAKITLQINSGGYVIGKGGLGADVDGTPEDGGDAINLSYDLTLNNSGTLGGGGGGGNWATDLGGACEAAGGGGAGYLVGEAGTGSQASSPDPFSNPVVIAAEDGTTELGGSGAEAFFGGSEPSSATGGKGGDLGQAGAVGSAPGGSGSGGAPGKAVNLNGFTLTEEVSGNIAGDIS